MVGNTYPYEQDDWMNDILLASSKGIDGFSLNVGVDSWQPERVADAYAAAKTLLYGKELSFKLFMSLDMTSLPCASASDGNILRDYIMRYQYHPNQFRYQGKQFISTFSGEHCTFGAQSVDQGWNQVIRNGLSSVHFVPSFFVDPGTFNQFTCLDGVFNWNSGWPMGNYDINNDSDNVYLSNLGGKTYMAAVSPWFFTHYGADTYNKNFIYRADDWLLPRRWELLIQNEVRADIVQVISWNDYGESHYFGPIEGAQPMSQGWTDGYDHQGWLDLMQYYISAYKAGKFLPVKRDRVFLWGRLYPVRAYAPDPVGKPGNWEFTQDFVWCVVLSSAPAKLSLSCGPSTLDVEVPSGVTKLRLPLESDCAVSARLTRDYETVVDFTPEGFSFSVNPPMYNFNAFVAASP
ncbi:glycoside hydrolase family 71 protein [Amanita thiersii Skay4041]|uniref:Glycoside hydrolase family 71 protein n=1 Tax=Amanita thiersii Skay4041 TaxID=703135 RepID=A0A2A9NVD8_9AGAR|nr:glycoside hydrolase family 71 protein [Amanita thiersii Skay4041]